MVPPVEPDAPQRGVVLAGAGGTAGALVGDVDLVHAVELAGGVAGQHARQAGPEPGADGHHHVALAGLGVQVEQASTAPTLSATDTTCVPAATARLATPRWRAGGDASTTMSTAAGSGSSTAVALSPSDATTAVRRRRSGSSTRTVSVPASATRCRAARAPTAPAPHTRKRTPATATRAR